MNDYQQRNEDQYSADAERVAMLVDEINKFTAPVEVWSAIGRDNDLDHCPTRHTIGCSSGLMIVCNHNGYGLDDRWRFSACGWPSYVDSNNRRVSVDTSRLYSPKETQPSTTAADTRTYDAIAKQIISKLIKPYRAIYARCAEVCVENDDYTKKEEAALKAVTEACGEAYEHGADRNRNLRAKVDGENIRGEFRSSGDVVLHMTAEQAIRALEAIR